MSSTSKVMMSLDDIIKQNRGENRSGRGRGRGRGRGGRGRGGSRRDFGERRRYNRFEDNRKEGALGGPREERRKRLFVSNLHKEINNNALRVYF
jgi:hypothetical protein